MSEVDVLDTLKEQRDRLRGEVRELEKELKRVDAAIAAYQGSRGHPRKTTRRRRGGRKKGSTHSAATKKKISQAMKKRWAERKKGQSKK